jgi:hypothetical protein
MRKMETKKYVSSYWQEGNIGGRRHMYSITNSGRTYYEENKVDFDYALLSLAHKQKKEEAQDNRKIYIPVDVSDNDKEAENKAVNLPLSKTKGITQTNAETKPEPQTQSIIDTNPGFKTETALQTEPTIPLTASQSKATPTIAPYTTQSNTEPTIPPIMAIGGTDRKTETITETKPELSTQHSTEPTIPLGITQSKSEPIIAPYVSQQKNDISPYISPKDPIISTKKRPQQIEITISGTLTVDMQPLLKPNSVKSPCGFLLFNRLRLFAGIVTAAMICIIYLVMAFNEKIPTLHAIAFEVLAGYLAVVTVIWLVLPQNKKELRFAKFIGLRFLLTLVAVIIIWAVYLLADTEEILWGIVPTIFCLIPVIEGGTMLIFQKSRWFFC